VRVGLRIASLVAVVVGEAVRENDQQTVGGSGSPPEDLSGAADARAEARVALRLELVEPCATAGGKTMSEGLDAREMDCGSAVGAKAVDGDPVAELLEREGQGGCCPSLVVVDGEPVRVGLGGGTGGVDEDEDAEVAGQFPPLQIDVLGRGVARTQVDGQIDQRLDVEVVAIRPAAEDLGAEAQTGQTSPKHLVVPHAGRGDVVGGAQREVDDPAPLRSIPVLVDVPLRI